MSVKLLTEQHLEFLSLTGGCTGWSECTLVKMSHCWQSLVTAQLCVEIVDTRIFLRKIRKKHSLNMVNVGEHNTVKPVLSGLSKIDKDRNDKMITL